jgi:hypothetical protein
LLLLDWGKPETANARGILIPQHLINRRFCSHYLTLSTVPWRACSNRPIAVGPFAGFAPRLKSHEWLPLDVDTQQGSAALRTSVGLREHAESNERCAAPAVCNVSDHKEGKEEMTKASESLQDLSQATFASTPVTYGLLTLPQDVTPKTRLLR